MMRSTDGAEMRYCWMSEDELGRLAEIDRTERVRIGYGMDGRSLVQTDVDWDVPPFWTEGPGDHTVAHQIAFCRGHLRAGVRRIGGFDGATLAGVGIVTPEVRPGMAQLAYLHVSRAYRRRGVGGQLVREMMAWAKAGGARRMVVDL
jgi:GNAT superfamily N-acetyltransferase